MAETDLRTKGGGTKFIRLSDGKTFDPNNPVYIEADWAVVANLKSVEPGELARDETEVDLLDNDLSEAKDYEPGQVDVGSDGYTLEWNPGSDLQKQLITDFENSTKTYYGRLYPNGFVDVKYGFISKVSKAVTRQDKITRTVTVRGCKYAAQDIAPATQE